MLLLCSRHFRIITAQTFFSSWIAIICFLLYALQRTIPWIIKHINFFIKTNWFWMRWTIRIKRTSTSCIYDSKLTCYSVVFIIIWLPNLMRAMHVYLTSTSSMCKTHKLEFQWHATQCLSLFQFTKPRGTCGGVVATSLCGLITVTCYCFQKNVLVLSHAHWQYMHEAKMCTHALIPSHAHTFLYVDPPHVIIWRV